MYRAIKSWSMDELAKILNNLESDGWSVVGGPIPLPVIDGRGHTYWAPGSQGSGEHVDCEIWAMIHKPKSKEPGV